MIDVNVTLSRWPFRRLFADDPSVLAGALRKRNVQQAWAGTFDGIFHKDLGGANARLAYDCRRYGEGLLIPFGSVNPKLPDWQEDLRRCHEVHKMPGIRLHPNYHSYGLDDPAFAELLRLATSRKMIVQLALSMEDERTQTALMPVPNVDAAPLPSVLRKAPGVRLVVMNANHLENADLVRELAAHEGVYFDFSMVERVGGVGQLARIATLARVVFGSNYPLYYFESAHLKVREGGFNAVETGAITEGNARGLLASFTAH
ncbi:MAG: amidohydrolase family protein [Bryobacteraceae bacterium]